MDDKTMLELAGVEVGQIWEERDSRFSQPRQVEVIGFRDGRVLLRGVKNGRQTSARIDRFNGKVRCYRLVAAAEIDKGMGVG